MTDIRARRTVLILPNLRQPWQNKKFLAADPCAEYVSCRMLKKGSAFLKRARFYIVA